MQGPVAAGAKPNSGCGPAGRRALSERHGAALARGSRGLTFKVYGLPGTTVNRARGTALAAALLGVS
jgi:hypothetical protein